MLRSLGSLTCLLLLFLVVRSRGEEKPGVQKVTSPLIIAHRGASGLRPEHTEGAYELAIEQGADFIECDLVMTKDGVLIIRHENEISGTTDVATKFPKLKTTKTVDGQSVTGWFSEDLTLKEIKTLRAKERLPERDHQYDGKWPVLTFDEFLALANERSKSKGRTIGVYVETKHPSYFSNLKLPLEEKVAASLKKAKLDRKDAPVFLQSFELSSLKKLKKLTENALVFLIDEPKMRPYDFVLSGDLRTYGDLIKPIALAEIRKTAEGIGPWKMLIIPEIVNKKISNATTLVADAHAVGLQVHPFTFRSDTTFLSNVYHGNPAAEYERFVKLGVDGVFTDFPADAMRAIRGKK